MAHTRERGSKASPQGPLHLCAGSPVAARSFPEAIADAVKRLNHLKFLVDSLEFLA
jgi:hypothetical protein